MRKMLFFILFFPFGVLHSFPLTNAAYTIEQDVLSGAGSVMIQKNAQYSIQEDVIAQGEVIGSSLYTSNILSHGYMGSIITGTVLYISSSVTFPENNSRISYIDEIRGECRSTTGLVQVNVSLQRLSDNKYYNGSEWQDGIIWLLTEGTGQWKYPVDKSIFEYNVYYKTAAKGVDEYGFQEGNFNANTFLFVYAVNFEKSVCNYPNPFFPSSSSKKSTTTIEYFLEKSEHISMIIYNFNYDKVKELTIQGQNETGIHYVPWDGRDSNGKIVPSGVYFLVIKTETKKVIHKIAVIN
ncbi:MAG: T9SS type A sorting domain-containing protein [Spirochaetes bacterium]|nr:T9SS type A sorting domain-containing protein [Spirochaetota bacterium]